MALNHDQEIETRVLFLYNILDSNIEILEVRAKQW